MNIEDLKKEIKKIEAPKMASFSNSNFLSLADVISQIKNQDREDEGYLFKNKILPLLAGLIFISVIVIITPVRNISMVTGILIMFTSMLTALILIIIDFRNISKESFDSTVLEFLKQKKRRLESWQSTRFHYYLIFISFCLGYFLMLLGNTKVIDSFNFSYAILIYIIFLVIVTISWIIGERVFRRKHRVKHQPLINIISEIQKELTAEEKL